MIKKLVLAVLAAGSIAMTSANAAVVKIDFANHDDEDFDVGEIYYEDGFNFTVISGDVFEIDESGGAGIPTGNPPSTLVIGDARSPAQGDTISITLDNGGLFSFDAVDYAAYWDTLDGFGVDLVGLVNGVVVETFTGLTSNTATFATLNPLFSGLIDELQIVATGLGDTSFLLDNFIFTAEVPLPAAVWMFLAGLGGLGFARKKRAQ